MLRQRGSSSSSLWWSGPTPPSKPPIASVIHRDQDLADFAPIRIITVPASLHRTVMNHKSYPLFEAHSGNVAFRRARGKFVLRTNMDNILSADMFQLIATGELREDSFYRATYMDHRVLQPEEPDPVQVMDTIFRSSEFTSAALELGNTLLNKYPEDSDVCLHHDADWDNHPGHTNTLYTSGSGDFVLTALQNIFDAQGYPQIAQNWEVDRLLLCRLRAYGVRQVMALPPCMVVHQHHDRPAAVRLRVRWVSNESVIDGHCADPFAPLPTDTAGGDNWGYADHEFEELVI